MPIEFKVKVGSVGHSLKITIPKEICEALDIKAGDTLAITVTDSEMVVRKKV